MLRRVIILCAIAGFLLSLSYNRYNLWVFSWFAFLPVILALKGKTGKQSFFIGLLSGIAFWSFTIYWLVHITLSGTIVLIFYLSLYFALFAYLISFYQLSSPGSLLFIPSAWVFLEYLRSHLLTGFPWALLGYSQYKNIPVIQIADIFGAWGVSFLVIMVNVGLYMVISRKLNAKIRKKIIVIVLSCLIAVLVYGYIKLNRKIPAGGALKISVVQGNIPQSLKWREGSENFIFDRYLEVTEEAEKENSDLVIWPEASLPVVLEDSPSYFNHLVERVKEWRVPLLFGAVTQRENLYYNSAVMLNEKGEFSGRYDKVHLVPFGEYIPLRNIFPFLQTVVPIGDVAAGREYTLFNIKDKLGVLICFEDLFPEISRAYSRKGANILVNITNDAWYRYTSAPFQHLQASVFRAVENRLPLARAANTGVSCFITASGVISSEVKDADGDDIFVKGFITGPVMPAGGRLTAYARFGDYLPVLCLFFAAYPFLIRRRRNV